MGLRQRETDTQVTAVDHPGAAGEPPQNGYPAGATPLEIGVLRILPITQHHDRPLPGTHEKTEIAVSRPFEEPRLARQVLHRRPVRFEDLESCSNLHHPRIEPQRGVSAKDRRGRNPG